MTAQKITAWDVGTNSPPLIGKGWRIRLDGEDMWLVAAFNMEEGWVDALCTDCELAQYGGAHLNAAGTDVCRAPRRFGVVTVIPPVEGR
jgi:hypothetical protein